MVWLLFHAKIPLIFVSRKRPQCNIQVKQSLQYKVMQGSCLERFFHRMMTSSNGNLFRVTDPFLWGIHRWPVNSPHNGQLRGALMFSLICAWTNCRVNNRTASDLKRHRAHYDVIATHRTGQLSCHVQLLLYNMDESKMNFPSNLNYKYTTPHAPNNRSRNGFLTILLLSIMHHCGGEMDLPQTKKQKRCRPV